MTILQRSALFISFVCAAVAVHATIGTGLQTQAGNPSGATSDPTNQTHYLIQRAQYDLDYNNTTREPNWVSWDLTAADLGSSGRSSSFFVDTTLPAGFYQVLTTDYSGSGYDRGHMCPSGDRTITRADNDVTFYMSNMVPQTPDNNQGVWASFETYCRTLASSGNEVLIVSGPGGFQGSAIASGVAIPGFTWKVVLVVPAGAGTAASRVTSSTRVIAIKIPNIAGIRSNPWQQYVTSAAQIEADTGYTFFSALSAPVRAALRVVVDGQAATGTPTISSQPVAQSAPVGGSATFSVTAASTTDTAFTYQWFKDDVDVAGATGASLTVSNLTAASAGTYTVVVTNSVGSVTSSGAALVVTGVPPSIASQPAARSAAAGTTVAFTVTATGSPTLTYQWRKGTTNLVNGGNVSGATVATLTLSNVQAADAGNYNVVVTNSVSSVTSADAALTVTAAAPTIVTPPVAQTVATGGTASFSVVASGTAPFTYQWRKGGTPLTNSATIAGATSATLTLSNVQTTDAGSYDVVVGNGISPDATSAAAALGVSATPVGAQLNYSGGTYSQNFDTLPTTGTITFTGFTAPYDLSAAPVSASGMAGWSLGTTLGTTTLIAGTGSVTNGAAYSFGASGSTDRALGTIASGSVVPRFGLKLINTTSSTITQFTLSYTGEWWRNGGNTSLAAQTLPFSYAVGGTDINTGTFTNATTLDFTSPTPTSSTAAAIDGNGTTNRVAISSTITGLSWAPGQSLVLRWSDINDTGNDHGLAIDDLTFTTPVNAAPTVPAVISSTPSNGASGVNGASPITVTFNQPVTVGSGWFSINSALTGPVAATVTGGPTTFTFTPPVNFTQSDTVTVTIFAAQVTESGSGTLHPTSNTIFSFTTAAPVAPTIATAPVATTVAAGGTATFSVVASGTAPFSYQWRKAGTPITGNGSATTSTLTLTNVQAADAANYDVVISNGVAPDVTSTPVALTVTPTAPSITTQPVAATVAYGANATFAVAAAGTTPFTYQWRKAGAPLTNGATTGGATISGATSATLTLTGVASADAGSYDVVVSNGVNPSATSTAATLTVTLPPPGPTTGYAGGNYHQDFNTLPSAGTFTFADKGPYALDAAAPNGVGASGLAGWSFAKYAGSGSVALFKFDAGTNTAGGIYSYGASAATDRSLGSVSSGTAISRFGVAFVNNTGNTLTQVTVSYVGEQWRHGGSTTPNKLTFSYALGANDINIGTFVAVPELDFTAPIVTTVTGALDGNDPANRTAIVPFCIRNISWAPGQVLVLRWTDVDDSGADDGLAVDDFSFTAAPAIEQQPVARTATVGDTVTFQVAATGTAPLTYQWRKNGDNMSDIGTASGTQTATLTLTNITTADAASYYCLVTDPAGSTASDSTSLTVNKATATVALGSLAATYNGSPRAATATTTPSGLAVTFTYNGSATAPTNVGTYAVVATIADANYVGTASGSLVISPASATITLGSLAQTYNGTARPVTVTTTPAGVATTVTYGGSATAPTAVGTYAVAATITDPNYTGSANGTLVITPAAASIAFTGLNQDFNGAPRIVGVVTTPAGLSTTLTYAGGATAPTAAGSYAVAATITDPNYTGSATGTLVVGKATATITFTGLLQEYSGAPRTVAVATSPGGLSVSVTYNGATSGPTTPGSYSVSATVSDANYQGSASATLTITKANAVITLADLNQVYTGTPRTVTATVTPAASGVRVLYAGSETPPVNAGSYAITATLDNANYQGSATGTLVVAKATQTVTIAGVPTAPRIATPFTVTVSASSGLPATLAVASGNATLSGTTVTLNDTSPVVLRATQAGDANTNAASADVTVTGSTKQTQAITFAAIPDKPSTAAPFALFATASSGLPVSFEIVSGPATISGSTVTLAGTAGAVTVRATQAGDAIVEAAAPVERSFAVFAATTAPVITAQPAPQGVLVGADVTFSVTATGSPTPTYQWRKDGSPLAGATGANLILPNVQTTSAGGYDVVVTNSAGSVTSALARLTVSTTPTAPVITRQPGNVVATVGQPATLSVAATGAPTPTYQWIRRSPGPGAATPVQVAGATSAVLTFGVTSVDDAGQYAVVVTNSAGSVTSSFANLAVNRRSFAGAYFGSAGNGGAFALYINADNTGVFLAFIPGSRVAYVSRAVVVDDSGHFRFVGSTTAAGPVAAASADTPPVAAAADDLVVEGTIADSGAVSAASTSGAPLALTGLKASGGPAAAGFYEAEAANSAAQTFAIVAPSGQAIVVTQSGGNVDGGSGTLDASGRLTVSTAARQTIALTVPADGAAVTASFTTANGNTLAFNGAASAAAQRVVNLSTRTSAGTGDQVAIVGFVITGLESKTVLIRAVGPALRNFGVASPLGAPRLELMRSGSNTPLATNTGWSTAANPVEIVNAASRSGAFPLAAGSADSVILTTVPPGSYTAVVTASDGRPGVGLVEVYDLSSDSAAQRLANLSTRALAGASDNTLIAGVVVTGTAPKRVLIRAAGPGLAQFGVSGVLARPQLTLFSNTGAVVATNTGWATSADAAAITEAAGRTGAFAFGATSADSAMVINLAPGAYTAQVTGVGGTTGVALVEIYEVP